MKKDIQQQLNEIKAKRAKLQKENEQLQKAIAILDNELDKTKLKKVREDIKSK